MDTPGYMYKEHTRIGGAKENEREQPLEFCYRLLLSSVIQMLIDNGLPTPVCVGVFADNFQFFGLPFSPT